jgi:hypothetical protein
MLERISMVASLCSAALLWCTNAQADYASRLAVGNWNGGVWVDNASKEFRNCGLAVKFAGGSEVTVIVPATLNPVIVIIDPRIKATPQQRFTVPVKWDQGPELQAPALALGPTMVQIALPAFPNSYDTTRKATKFATALPGLNSSFDITGMAGVLPRLLECAITERAKMTLPPSAAQETPADRNEAAMAGLALAEKSGVGNYIVFADKARPPGFQGAPSVWGHVGVPGPGGPANVLCSAYWQTPAAGPSIAEAKATLLERLKSLNKDPKAQYGDLPPIPGRPDTAGVYSIGNNVYEELYLVKRRNGGFFQFTSSTPLPARATAEAVGARYRAAIAAMFP